MGTGPTVNPYTRLVLREKILLSGLFFYRVTHLLSDLGWVDLDFGCSTVHLLGQHRSCSTAQTEVNPTQVREEMDHPVSVFLFFLYAASTVSISTNLHS